MKKIFSLLCATLLVFSASAAPVAQKAQLVKKAPVAVEQVQKVQFEKAQPAMKVSLEKAQIANLNQLSATPAVKVNNFTPSLAIKKAPKAEPTVVIIKGNPQIVSKSGKTTIEATGNDDIIYGWIVSTESLEAGKTYTYADMGEHNVYRYDNSFTVYEEATDGTFSIDAENNITASMVTESGTYLVYTTAPQVDPEATKVVGEDLYQETGYIQIYADGYYYMFSKEGAFELGQTYTLDDLYVAEVMDESYNEDIATAATIKLTEKENLLHIDATMTTESGAKYEITYDEPQPKTVDITATLLKTQSSSTQYLYNLIDEAGNNFQFYFYLAAAFELGKTYTEADLIDRFGPDYVMSYVIPAGSKYYYTYSKVSFTMTEDESNLKHIVASVKVPGLTTIFNIKYDEVPFVPTGVQIDVVANNYAANYKSSWEEYEYTASNDDYSKIYLLVYTDEEFGTFNEEVDVDFCTLTKAESGSVSFHSVATPIVVAKDEDGNKSLKGSLYATNGDEYVFNLTYEKPKTESISVLVEDATMTKKTLFFQVDGNDTENAYGITVRVNSKVLEGEFTLDNCEPYNTGVTDLSTKKWFDTDSCYIQTQMLGSNTLLMQGILYTHNTALDRYINAEFVLTARVDANGELMDIYGGIVTPAKGDTISLTRSEKGTAFFKTTSGLSFGDQSGKTTMVAVNDSAYYWYKPISKLTTGSYWIKGIKDKEANTINFDTAQVINVYNGGLLGLMKWMKATTQGKFTIATDGAKQFVLDINEDTLTLHGSAPFDKTQDIYFPGVVVPGYGFQGYGDAGTILTVNKPITERDTVDVVTTFMRVDDFVEDMGVAQLWVGADYLQTTGDIQFSVTIQNTKSLTGTFSFAKNTLMNDFTLIINSEGEKTFFQNGEVTITNDEYPILKGWLIGDDEKYYRLDWSKKPIEKRDTLRFSGQGVTISECVSSQTGVQTGWLYGVTDASTGYRFTLQSTVVANKYGTFSYEDKTLGSNYYNVYDPQGNRQQFTEGSITVGEVGDSLILDGELIAEDEKVYILHFAQSNKVLNYDTDAPFDATFAYGDMSTDLDEGVISIYATNAEGFTIGLELYADPTATKIPEGVYTISDSQEAGTALQSLGVAGGYLTECYAGTLAASGGIDDCWFLVEGTITLSYDEYGKLKVVVDAKNSYEQPVTALVQYVKIDPKGSVDIADADFTVYEGYLEKYGIMNFYGANAEGYEFDLYAYADTYAGDFLEAIDFVDCGIYLTDGSSVGVMDAYEFKIEAEGKNLTLTAKVLGTDTIQYNITATGFYGAIDYDATEAYEGEFAIENITLIQATKTQVMLNGINAAGDSIALVFDAKFSKTVGVVEEAKAGEYDVIMASTGITGEGQITPSFVATAENQWFIQSGKLTVAEDGSMVFEGLNSYDQAVKVTVTVPAPVGITVNVTVPEGTPACYFYGEMSGNTFVEMTKLDDTHYTTEFPDATTIGWGYLFVWENGNWNTKNADPEGDIKVEPVNGVIDIEIKAWVTAPGTEFKYTTYTEWQVKYGPAWEWVNMTKQEDGTFTVEAVWGNTGINIASGENPIKQDWYPLDDAALTVAQDVAEGDDVVITLTVVDDETVALDVTKKVITGLNNAKANVKAAKRVANGQIVIVRDNKEYNILGTAL